MRKQHSLETIMIVNSNVASIKKSRIGFAQFTILSFGLFLECSSIVYPNYIRNINENSFKLKISEVQMAFLGQRFLCELKRNQRSSTLFEKIGTNQ